MKEYHIDKGPFIKSENETSKIMLHLLIALLPIIVFAFYKNGYIPYVNGYTNLYELFYPLIMIGTGVLTSFLSELLIVRYAFKKKGEELKHYLRNSYSFFPGLFLALILPINTPLILVIFGALCATIIGKMVYGGFGQNVFNPALIGRLFVISCYAMLITNAGGYLNKMEVDTISSSTPLSHLSTSEYVGSYEEVVEPFGGMLELAIGLKPGCIGEVSAILCILAFVYLSITKVIKWRIPTIYVGTVFLMTMIIGFSNQMGLWYPLFHILNGGLLFGAVFMATDPVTSPTTPVGQVIYGLGLGILTVIFRFLTPYPEGVLTSILTMNMLVFIIDRIGAKSRFDLKKASIPLSVIGILTICLPFYIGNKIKPVTTTTEKDPNFNVIGHMIEGNNHVYTVSQKGYGGPIKGKIIINDEKIIQIEVLEHNEDFMQTVLNADYLKTIINNQDNFDDVDTVSGATISSNALKKMAKNTLQEYKGEYANE